MNRLDQQKKQMKYKRYGLGFETVAGMGGDYRRVTVSLSLSPSPQLTLARPCQNQALMHVITLLDRICGLQSLVFVGCYNRAFGDYRISNLNPLRTFRASYTLPYGGNRVLRFECETGLVMVINSLYRLLCLGYCKCLLPKQKWAS